MYQAWMQMETYSGDEEILVNINNRPARVEGQHVHLDQPRLPAVHVSSSSKCTSPPIPFPGWKAWASTPRGPSKGKKSPWAAGNLNVLIEIQMQTSTHKCFKCTSDADFFLTSHSNSSNWKTSTYICKSVFRFQACAQLVMCVELLKTSQGTRNYWALAPSSGWTLYRIRTLMYVVLTLLCINF